MFAIFGGDGFLGAYTVKYLLGSTAQNIVSFNHSANVFCDSERLTNIHFDLTDKNDILSAQKIINASSDVHIIYLIACHNPDIVKSNPGAAEEINIKLYSEFLQGLKNADIRSFYYSSSDTVYGESVNGERFSEDSPAEPVNIYGMHKLAAEKITLSNGYSAVRFPYLAAPSILSRKKHFFDGLVKSLQNNEEIRMLTDYIRSSVSYPAAAKYITALSMTETREKIINICADKPTSKYDLGLLAADFIHADRKLVIPVTFEELNIFDEKRAKNIVMSNSLLKNILNINEEIRLTIN